MAKRPTFRDIAKQADVALSTVSQVLNNKPNVSAETRQHVLKVATDLGYRQKVLTNGVIGAHLSTIGLLTKSIEGDPLSINPFYSYILAGAEHECQRINSNLMYANIEVDSRNHALKWPNMLLDEVVDGVIVVGTFLEETIADISKRVGRNVVLVDAYSSQDNAFDSVLIDNFNGAVNAVSCLVEQGHKHIGLIGSNPESYPSILDRRTGYLAALVYHGIQSPYIIDGELERASAYNDTIEMMQQFPEITAIFVCNDECAISVMHALREMNLRVPKDVSVIGFDDIDLAQEVMPPLTTMHVDKVLMGALAVRHLRDRVEAPERPTVKTLVSTQLIARNSVRQIES